MADILNFYRAWQHFSVFPVWAIGYGSKGIIWDIYTQHFNLPRLKTVQC